MSAVRLDKARVRQAFSAASGTYDGVAELQRLVGLELLQNISIDSLCGTILDLGCGTGFLTAELLKRQPRSNTVIALDLAWPMLQTARRKLAHSVAEGGSRKLIYLCADAERLPIADHTLDGIVSNLALQWCHPTDAVLFGLKRLLKPGSPLVFSIFGPATLSELKSAWATVDDYSHVNEFYSAQKLRRFLRQAGFTEPSITVKCHRPRYESVRALMLELKHIGAHNVNNGRNKRLTAKSKMLGMMSAYEQFREDGLIPASFEVIQVVARA